jgi:hypothetical protein
MNFYFILAFIGPLNYTLQTSGATGQVFYGNEVDVKDVFKVDQTTGAVSLVRKIDREVRNM